MCGKGKLMKAMFGLLAALVLFVVWPDTFGQEPPAQDVRLLKQDQ